MAWGQISVVIFMSLTAIWGVVILLPCMLSEIRWWDRYGQAWKKSAAFTIDSVDYWAKGMPKNSSACRRSAEVHRAEAEKMMRDRLSA